MNGSFVGANPRLPWPLNRSAWWTRPVRAERLAVLRIGVGLAVMFDILLTYLPYTELLYGAGSLGAPDPLGNAFTSRLWFWSPLGDVGSQWIWIVILLTWAASAGLLALGLRPKIAAAACLLIALFVSNANPYIFNSGDSVRDILLFYLMLSPSGAVWSFDSRNDPSEEVYVSPWSLRVLFVQMAIIYLVNGISKAQSQIWLNGGALHYILSTHDWSLLSISLPFWMTRIATWVTLIWELAFVLLVANRPTRKVTLWIGVMFHVATLLTLRIGFFGIYMLCFYLPLLPWDRWRDQMRKRSPKLANQPA
ncbi:MAG: HTTM domain-containing protein [Acidimicrobiia bacterium]|nr:HTTM domain-containing protein [Acidimicrobiia bacterium]